jgi:RNA polymerase sigma-70 factor (ECF subfamily)
MRMTPEIEEAIGRCQAGEAEPFRVIVEAYRRIAVTLAFRLLRDRDDAEDAAQESFVKAWESLPWLRDTARFRAWFARIVTNEALMRLRHQRREMMLRDDEKEPTAQAQTSHDPATAAIDAITRERVERAIMELPLRYRTALSLHYVAGLTYEEAAEAMEAPVGTVKAQCWRAKQMLLERLKQDDHEVRG